MDYYEQLYDINFFSCDDYKAQKESSEITILNPGNPDWETWKSQNLSKKLAREIWNDFKKNSGNESETLLLKKTLKKNDFLLLLLILCEDAYRRFDSEAFYFLNRILYTSNNPVLRLKATKLQYAWLSLFRLSRKKNPLKDIINHGLNYLNRRFQISQSFNIDQVKVEVPVRNDWIKQKVMYEDKESVLNFYKHTHSYILELIAANHQVETLFNYYVILDILKRLGISTCFDYGGGIGTFSLLAETFNINCIFSDIESETMSYAKERLKYLNSDVSLFLLRPDKIIIPENLECILCTEVLEHIFEPDAIIRAIYKSLRPSGILVVSESFDYIDNFCTHLPRHKGKGGANFFKYLKKIGFKQIKPIFSIHPTIHIKI
jgi:2-polyprenyl-3-methyl-5-hydroxy-6-metoxy-1,4-benzoquinol methylase